MFLMRFLRSLIGWVQFEAEGGFPERLLNFAAREKIRLWNTYRRGVCLNACCRARDYRKLRPLARRACMRLRVQKKHGVPFFLHRYRARAGILVGVVVFAALFRLLSARIWVIDMHGLEATTRQEVLAVLEPLGVRLGAPAAALDMTAIQLAGIQKLEHVSWLAVNLEGSIAHVEIKERGALPEITDTGRPSNIKAARTGVILSMTVTSGQPAVKVGDAVAEGTLLVSGVVDSTKGPILKRAQAVILAETSRTLTVRVPLRETRLLPTGETLYRPTLDVFGMHIPLFTDGPIDAEYALELDERPVMANGIALPVGYTGRTYRLLAPAEIVRSEEEAALLAAELLEGKVAGELGAVTITARTQAGRLEDGWYVLTGQYTCTEDIGVEEQLLFAEEAASR